MIKIYKPGIARKMEANKKIHDYGSENLAYWIFPMVVFVGFYGVLIGVETQPYPYRRYAPILWSSYTLVKRRYKGVETEFLEQI